MTRLVQTALVFVLWLTITLVGGTMITQGQGELSDLVRHGVGWHFVLACLLLVAAITLFRWRDIPFGRVAILPTLKLMWLPLVVLAWLAIAAAALQPPPAIQVLFILVNTLMVGFSEETMLRGVVLSALRPVMRIWPAILITTLVFGAIHSLNVFTTGALLPALVQSVTAAMSGLLFVAIVIRTGSLWPAILYHAAWDFFTFMIGSSGDAQAAGPPDNVITLGAVLLPMLVVLPNFLYALWLLRKLGDGARGLNL